MTLEQLYEVRIDSTRSINYYGEFDCFCETVFFSLCDGDTGDALKSYEVSFDEDTGEVDYDVEYTSDNDSGYCNFKRLPKCVREHVLAIVKACIEEQTEEEEEQAEEEQTEEQTEESEKKAEMNTSTEVNTMKKTLAQQYNAMVKSDYSVEELEDFCKQYRVSEGTCSLNWLVSYSAIFADSSVWGFSDLFEYETELDNFGHNTRVTYKTTYR